MAFSTDDVPVTMRGDEWFALLAVLNTGVTVGLSAKSVRKFEKGKAKLESQLLAASAGGGRKRAEPTKGESA